jgi:hypothetical protein
MVPFFTITLIISIAAISMLFLLKQIELSTGSVIFGSMRPKINRFFKTVLVLVERVLPGLAHEGFMHVLGRLRVWAMKVLAHAVLKVEVGLQKALHWLREKVHPQHHRGEASPFLKEVGEYKKKLETETQEDQTLY